MTLISSPLLVGTGSALIYLSTQTLSLIPLEGSYSGYIPSIIGMALGGATTFIAFIDILRSKWHE